MHKQKIIVTVWWSTICVIHYSCLETNQSITAEIYYNWLPDMHASCKKIVLPWWINVVQFYSTITHGHSHVTRLNLQKLIDFGYETLPILHILQTFRLLIIKDLSTFWNGKTFLSKEEVESTFRDFVASEPNSSYFD